jgi:tRNA nucleotidyltransferase/poly(A) polymerase
MENLKNIQLSFLDDIKKIGGGVYLVGGVVRDSFLGKPSKDIDIVITKVEPNKLKTILSKYGKMDVVGESFGVIKYVDYKTGQELDIALPRTELANGNGGYKGFDVNVDHNLPIEKDLERRDTKFNSMAYDVINNKLIDPFGGAEDIQNKSISATSEKSFIEDPLRMLRVVAQSSRFNFNIEPKTFELIKNNANNISRISKERILIEFDKIVYKGKPRVGATLLVETGLYQSIFGFDFNGDYEPFDYVTRMSEFIFWLTKGFAKEPDQYFKITMKGDKKITKEISALSYLYSNLPGDDVIKQRWVYYKLYDMAPSILFSKFVQSHLNDVIDGFMVNKYPASIGKLTVNGNDLIKIGLSGKSIDDALLKAIGAIYSDEIKNDKSEILDYLQK